jgi:hypothetical protein
MEQSNSWEEDGRSTGQWDLHILLKLKIQQHHVRNSQSMGATQKQYKMLNKIHRCVNF